jgi:hypothetical protein
MSDEQLHTLMERALGDVDPTPDALAATSGKVLHRSRRRKSLTIVTAALLSGASILLAATAFQGGQDLPGNSVTPGAHASSPQPGNYPEPLKGVSALPLQALAEPRGTSTIPFSFPDGTRVVLEFDDKVDLMGLGIRASSSGDIGASSVGSGCCARPIELLYGTPASTGLLSDTVLQTFRGVAGVDVDLQKGDPQNGADLYLVYRFGPWTALVYDTTDPESGMSTEERSRWASGLSATVEPGGAIALEATGELVLAEPGFPAGPALLIVGPGHEPELSVYPSKCEPGGPVPIDQIPAQGAGRGVWFADWCPPGGLVRAQLSSADEEVVRTLVAGLEVR